MTVTSAEILSIYKEADQFYRDKVGPLGGAALGYEVLYGPPIKNPPILFVGYQPGGGRFEALPVLAGSGESPPWPAQFEFARVTEADGANPPFLLAARMQVAFGVDFLGSCTGMNAVLLRAPGMDDYRASMPPNIRKVAEELGTSAVRKVIELLEPHLVLMLGFATLDLFKLTTNVVMNGDAGLALMSEAKLNGTPVFGMRHPTGSIPRPSNDELRKIGSYLLGRILPTKSILAAGAWSGISRRW